MAKMTAKIQSAHMHTHTHTHTTYVHTLATRRDGAQYMTWCSASRRLTSAWEEGLNRFLLDLKSAISSSDFVSLATPPWDKAGRVLVDSATEPWHCSEVKVEQAQLDKSWLTRGDASVLTERSVAWYRQMAAASTLSSTFHSICY